MSFLTSAKTKFYKFKIEKAFNIHIKAHQKFQLLFHVNVFVKLFFYMFLALGVLSEFLFKYGEPCTYVIGARKVFSLIFLMLLQFFFKAHRVYKGGAPNYQVVIWVVSVIRRKAFDAFKEIQGIFKLNAAVNYVVGDKFVKVVLQTDYAHKFHFDY